MPSVEMVEADVLSAAQTIQSAADQSAAITPATRLADVATALPGGTSAGAATTLGTDWEEDLQRWRQSVQRQSSGLTTAAAEITQTDVRVSERFGGPRAV